MGKEKRRFWQFFKKSELKKFEKKVEEKAKKVKKFEKEKIQKLNSPLSKIIITGAAIFLLVIVMQFYPQLKPNFLELQNLKQWWTYPIAAIALFLILIGLQKFVKKRLTIQGEEERIVKEVDELLKKEKKLKEEEKKIKKEIEVLVDKTLELFELDKQQTKVKKKGKELKKALEQPFKDYNDVKKVLTIMDELLAKLPENEVEKFAKSEASKLYEKVMKKYG